jgi:hypothetical protein
MKSSESSSHNILQVESPLSSNKSVGTHNVNNLKPSLKTIRSTNEASSASKHKTYYPNIPLDPLTLTNRFLFKSKQSADGNVSDKRRLGSIIKNVCELEMNGLDLFFQSEQSDGTSREIIFQAIFI